MMCIYIYISISIYIYIYVCVCLCVCVHVCVCIYIYMHTFFGLLSLKQIQAMKIDIVLFRPSWDDGLHARQWMHQWAQGAQGAKGRSARRNLGVASEFDSTSPWSFWPLISPWWPCWCPSCCQKGSSWRRLGRIVQSARQSYVPLKAHVKSRTMKRSVSLYPLPTCVPLK